MTMEFNPTKEMKKMQKKMNIFDHRFNMSNNNCSVIGTPYHHQQQPHRINIWRPVVTIKDNKSFISITFELPGLNKDNISIEVTKENSLVITGEKKSKLSSQSTLQQQQQQQPTICPLNHGDPNTISNNLAPSFNDLQQKNIITIGKFIRSYKLPSGTDSSKIKASMDDGLLEISIPKEVISEERLKIPIQSKL